MQLPRLIYQGKVISQASHWLWFPTSDDMLQSNANHQSLILRRLADIARVQGVFI
jgi:hypothetical protein